MCMYLFYLRYLIPAKNYINQTYITTFSNQYTISVMQRLAIFI